MGKGYGNASEGSSSKKASQKENSKRYSARAKKPVTHEDLGYVEKDSGKKGGKLSYNTSEGYKKCERLLGTLKKHPSAGAFLQPVDVPGYAEVITDPMDLSTVENKLKAGMYQSSYHFALDVRKIWNNSWKYNQDGTDIYLATTEMSKFFEKGMKEVGELPFSTEECVEIQELKKQVSKVSGALKKIKTTAGAGLQSKTGGAGGSKGGMMEKEMSMQEKATLKQNIMKLPQDKLTGVISIIQDTVDTNKNKEVLEFDIDTLPTRKCRELELYVKKNIPSASKSSKKKKTSKGEAKASSPKASASKSALETPKTDVFFFKLLFSLGNSQ